MKRYFIFILILWFFVDISYSAFENEYWGGRAKGMAGAFSAISDDYSAPMWNPAGLDNLGYCGILFMYSKPFWGFDDEIGFNNYFFSIFYPNYKYGGFAFTFTRFSATDLYRENSYILSYGVNINKFWDSLFFYWQVGVNFKIYNRGFVLDERSKNDVVFSKGTSSTVCAFDFGTLISPLVEENQNYWVIGISLFNLNQPDIGLRSQDEIERRYNIGFAYNFYFAKLFKNTVVTPSVQYALNGNYMERISAGIEIWIYNNLIGIRGGWNTDEITAGLSANYRINKDVIILFDYTFLLPAHIKYNTTSHMFSLSFKFPGITLKISNVDSGEIGNPVIGSSSESEEEIDSTQAADDEEEYEYEEEGADEEIIEDDEGSEEYEYTTEDEETSDEYYEEDEEYQDEEEYEYEDEEEYESE